MPRLSVRIDMKTIRDYFSIFSGGQAVKDHLAIGCCPCDEAAVQVGVDDYRALAGAQARRYVEAIRTVLGDEPKGAGLGGKWFAHDFGSYCEVVCWYETENPAAAEYAFRCESEAPSRWPEGLEKAESEVAA